MNGESPQEATNGSKLLRFRHESNSLTQIDLDMSILSFFLVLPILSLNQS